MDKTRVTLTIRDAKKLSMGECEEIANWLKAQAKYLLCHKDELAPVFHARYLYRGDEKGA